MMDFNTIVALAQAGFTKSEIGKIYAATAAPQPAAPQPAAPQPAAPQPAAPQPAAPQPAAPQPAVQQPAAYLSELLNSMGQTIPQPRTADQAAHDIFASMLGVAGEEGRK